MNQELQASLQHLPNNPGVYLMKDQTGQIIYVGKAKILKNRVRSYFNGQKDRKTQILLSKIFSLNWIVTQTEHEALILENNLIKEHNPKYNINLKDGKTYPVIKLTKDAFPRVFRTRTILKDGAAYFGPFPATQAIDQYLEIIEQSFPLRKCKGPLKTRASPCLYYHINRCPGPCFSELGKTQYQEHVKAIKALLGGKSANLKRDLKQQMLASSKLQEFEKAAKYRDALRSLEIITESQQVQDFNPEDRDFIAYFQDEERLGLEIFQMRQGKLLGNQRYRLEIWQELSDALEQILIQHYTTELPQKLVILGLEDPQNVSCYLSTQAGHEVKVQGPSNKREEALLAMARENARQDLARWKIETGDTEGLKDLQKLLNLPKLPLRIEGFDIAHLHGKHTVAALVSFWQGIPDKKNYRLFKIRSLDGAIDDYESLREALARNYSRMLNENLPRPDLILIDGGKGQLNAAQGILKALGLEDLPLCSLAKEEEEVFLPQQSAALRIPEGSPALRILQAVRDEAHRFGTQHNQKLRTADLKLDQLEAVKGLGPKRAKTLLAEYASLAAIRQADPAQMAAKTKIPQKILIQVQQQLAAKTEQPDSSTEWPEIPNQDSLAAEISLDVAKSDPDQTDSD